MGQKQNTEIRQEESPEEVRESIETGEIVILEIGSAAGAPCAAPHGAGLPGTFCEHRSPGGAACGLPEADGWKTEERISVVRA